MTFTELLLLALPIASMTWTITNEEVFKEFRRWCARHSRDETLGLLWRKLCYVWTCEYCFSHWVTAGWLVLTQTPLLYDDWRGFVVAEFALVWIANLYITLYALLRQTLRQRKAEAAYAEHATDSTTVRG